MQAKTQLYRFAGDRFEVFAFWDPDKGRKTKQVETLPLVFWPSGRWCLEVNLFFSSLLEQGYSTRSRGGTLGTYAAYLTPLLHYCESTGKRFIDLKDVDFSKCVRALYEAKKVRSGTSVARYNRTTIRSMACVWLDFLEFVGTFHDDEDLLGNEGRIRAWRESHRIEVDGRAIHTSGWHHWSINAPDPYNHRLPITEQNLSRLRAAATSIGRSHFARLRRLVMLELFDCVGLRRTEAATLTVGDVQSAIDMWKAQAVDKSMQERASAEHDELADAPFLAFQPVKGNNRREVPVSPVTLQFFEQYLTRRARLLARFGIDGRRRDLPFFINVKSGEALTPNTFTLEFSTLAKAAKITGPCSPHMARHRYIVRTFVRLVRAHRIQNPDAFRQAMLDSIAFKEKVSQLTGHQSIASLDFYLNLAFEEVGGLSKTMSRVYAQQHIDALIVANERYKTAISAGEDARIAASELSSAIDALSTVTSYRPDSKTT